MWPRKTFKWKKIPRLGFIRSCFLSDRSTVNPSAHKFKVIFPAQTGQYTNHISKQKHSCQASIYISNPLLFHNYVNANITNVSRLLYQLHHLQQ